MERLTFDGNFCDIAQCREQPCPYNGSCTQREVWERLKAYEDTGLTPEEITAMRHTLEEYHRTADPLLSAKAQGRVVVLPCKVGDTVYILRRTFDGADVVGETELWWTDIPQLGKTVFLTREEAEAALEAMKNE